MRRESEQRYGPRKFPAASPLLILIAVVLLAACSGPSAPPPGPSPTNSPQHLIVPTALPPEILRGELESAKKAAREFADALHKEQYEKMWSMLGSRAQSRWRDEQAYSGFLSRKFGSRDTVLEVGDAQPSSDGSSVVVDVQLTGGASTYQWTLSLERRDDSWLIADAGPAGPNGPIIDEPNSRSIADNELNVPILIYHHIAPQLPEAGDERNNTVTTAAFDEQLDWLAANGYEAITVAELFNAFYYDLPLPAKPVILVFDDSYEDAYTQAFPVLRRYKFRATVATITGAVDQPGYLSWDQIREMADAGVEFVSHTVSHANLALSDANAARSELAESKRALEEGLGRPVQFLVYPYGEPFTSGSDSAQETILTLLPQEGYVGALTTSSGPPYISLQEAGAPYQLHRIPVSGGETLARFAASIGAEP